MQLTRHPAAAPQNTGPGVAQDMVRFEVREVIEVHRVMYRPEAILVPGHLAGLFSRQECDLVNVSLFPDFKERLDTEPRPTKRAKNIESLSCTS